ncbi:hypothetical protein BASA50_003373 [Batrachochytrium salamandrivorans]|uniref:Gfo/Idh/MocA-like oxidoreductase N-terminal domain-containing protein n=1 Tax=Batrachochytrium salamandrivorans TaxID=1357716 RepID=A0ABQ8FII2_9FUNG|nr:hypothetical protein BASA60_009779 [Batrachochytrium salamandrivorans]KAH6598866.1 hypothetical protein BASA50_003373 [Batrachochytrium salamandrivorans]KAH9250206.1 hypothetical protein BASA81_012014 [Batrachochytrium salamandrivorans]
MMRMGPAEPATGEYTTGYVHDGASGSDKKIGVVGLVLYDMRRRGKVDWIGMVGTTGRKNSGLRAHLDSQIARGYKDMDVTTELFPADDVTYSPTEYMRAIDRMQPGDGITIFTPDDTHFDIALYAIRHKLHVLIAKPAVQSVAHHKILIQEARNHGVLVVIEFHKRFDPIYSDARERIRSLGDFGFFSSYMSQPKFQLHTFRSWAGKSSDISYYLNAHHIDMHIWSLKGHARPVSVTASAAAGVATGAPYDCVAGTMDTITLLVTWENIASGNPGTAVYTASWAAPKAEVHSQQRFFYTGHKGEVRVDQAHRGYEVATDASGYASVNPLFMRYTPDAHGYYCGQQGYGHQSIEAWADACLAIKQGKSTSADFVGQLSTLEDTLTVTAVLEAGHKSLQRGGVPVPIDVDL